MLMHYVPEVEEGRRFSSFSRWLIPGERRVVVQVLEEHEEISKAEFAKLEKELAKSN